MAARNTPLRSAAACQPITVSMGRRGNLCDKASAEIFMKKTLKVEALCLVNYETFKHVTAAFSALH